MALGTFQPFVWGAGGEALTPEELARREAIEARRMAQGIDTSPVGHWSQGAARVANALVGAMNRGQLGQERTALEAENATFVSDALRGFGTKEGAASTAPAAYGAGYPPATSAPGTGDFSPDLRTGIQTTAKALGVDPVDLATAISYETAGTFNPTIAGPRTQWGQHKGLIQFGEAQAGKYGVNWDDPVNSQLGENGAIARYLLDAGVQPGMGLPEIYSAINAGGVGRMQATDAHNGGAPGTVADKVAGMGDHRQKAIALLGPALADQPQMPAEAAPAQMLAQAAVGGGQPVRVASAEPGISPTLMAFAQQGGAVDPQSRPDPVRMVTDAVMQSQIAAPQSGGQSSTGGGGAIPDPIVRALTSPRSTPGTQRIAEALLSNWMRQQQPREIMNVGNGQLYNPNNGQWISAPSTGRQPLVNAGEGRLYDPNTRGWITAPDAGTKAPAVQEFYDEQTGQPYVAQWNRDTGEWSRVGGTKAPATRPLPQNTVNALSEAGAGYSDMNRISGGFQDDFGGQPWLGDATNYWGRTFADEGSPAAKQAQWWQDYQGQKNQTRNRLFGSALTATEKGEFEKADVNPSMSANAIRANLQRQAEVARRAASKLADYYTKAGYPEDQIEAAIGIPLADLRGGQDGQPGSAPQGARQAPDGNFYVPDPARPGKYLQVQP